jgi:hypothetical protein
MTPAEKRAAAKAQKIRAKASNMEYKMNQKLKKEAGKAYGKSAVMSAKERLAQARATAKMGNSMKFKAGGSGNSAMPGYGWSGTNQKFGTGK